MGTARGPDRRLQGLGKDSGELSVIPWGQSFLVWEDGHVLLEVGGGEGPTMMSVCITPHMKMLKTVNLTVCVFSHSQKSLPLKSCPRGASHAANPSMLCPKLPLGGQVLE